LTGPDDQGGEAQCCALSVKFGLSHIGLRPCGLNVGARSVLGRHITGLQASLRRLGHGLHAGGNALQLFDAQMRRQPVIERLQRQDALGGDGVLPICLRGLGGLSGGLRAQVTLIAALPGPVQPHALVNALVL